MNANPLIDDIDLVMHDGFLDAGMASMGDYSPIAGGVMFSRRCYVNTAGQTAGQFSEITAPRTVVGFFLDEGVPAKGDSVVVASRAYVLQAIDETDEDDGSLQWWVVRND